MINGLQNLIEKKIAFAVGIITYVDMDTGKCIIKVDDVDPVECDICFCKANSDSDAGIVWGNINYPSRGDFVLLIFENGLPRILTYLTGYQNIDDIYENGGVYINRILDSEDPDTSPDTKLKIGEFLLRSLGLGDMFFDKFGNILMDTHKECVFRIGDRDSDNIISSPETVLRIGRIKDVDGSIKKDADDKALKLELVFSDDNKLTLNSDGKWHIETNNPSGNNASLDIQNNGVIVINSGAVKVARDGDNVDKTTTFGTWLNAHVHGAAGTIPVTPFSASQIGDINGGNPNFLSD